MVVLSPCNPLIRILESMPEPSSHPSFNHSDPFGLCAESLRVDLLRGLDTKQRSQQPLSKEYAWASKKITIYFSEVHSLIKGNHSGIYLE